MRPRKRRIVRFGSAFLFGSGSPTSSIDAANLTSISAGCSNGCSIQHQLAITRRSRRLSVDNSASHSRLPIPQCHPPGFLVRLIAGALVEKAAGVKVLIHGLPGTGKTELARTLAQAANAARHAVGEADEDGDEPIRGHG